MNDATATKVLRPSLIDRTGIPAPLLCGFIGVLLFMTGDGVESNYLSRFLVDSQGFTQSSAAVTISLYGIFATIGSWLAGTLSATLGPRKVMLIGALNWLILEAVFLLIGIWGAVHWVAVAAYTLRGIGYPFFAYAFLVWINIATPAHQRGSSVGWFWFAFGAGLPTLGSLMASMTIPLIGEYGTFWLATVMVVLGGAVALLGVRDLSHAGPASNNAGGLGELAKGLTIVWRRPRVSAGALVRLINTTPNFALFVVAPFFFIEKVGFSQSQYLHIVTVVYTTNIFANLFFGIIGDRFGWRRTVTWFGCVMCAVGTLLFYYVPLAVGPDYWVAVVCWSVFAIGLAGFVPLTALVPSLVRPEERGSALALYTLAAGLSAFLGPALVAMLGGTGHLEGLVWIFALMYLLGAIVTLALGSEEDPGQR
ncbi:alpha-ketoglutarate permease [Pseudomonas syringae pv. avellanae str. ISPaVe013]|uniref:MFS transporter n=1 Tax=Pseudomonas syringae TaxID=317 RepID=UPI00028DC622|nr:MFS transporter [Pseudomonas syringae]EKG40171.1 alpha-ketoglutarate permease [Pseudomonas syringae pv. avellanae str. ISPaVe013]